MVSHFGLCCCPEGEVEGTFKFAPNARLNGTRKVLDAGRPGEAGLPMQCLLALNWMMIKHRQCFDGNLSQNSRSK